MDVLALCVGLDDGLHFIPYTARDGGRAIILDDHFSKMQRADVDGIVEKRDVGIDGAI